MRRCLQSVYIKKNTFPDAVNERLSEDLALFNQMKRTSFEHQLQNRQEWDKDGNPISPHVFLTRTFGVKDYFATSACGAAKAIVSSQKELRELYLSDLKEDIKAIEKKITSKKKYLTSLEKVKQRMIDYCNARKRNMKHPESFLKGTKNIRFLLKEADEMGNIPVELQFFGKGRRFDSVYLFEHQWLDWKIKNLKNQVKQMDHKLQVKKARHEKLKHKSPAVHFGGKKFMNNRDLPNRKQCLAKRRNKRMLISGRLDAVSGNFVFRYDAERHQLTYRSMTDWDGERIHFQVEFPYGQEWIDEFVREKQGAVAWELVDCGNAWQINCLLQVLQKEKNDYYGAGCIGLDINYNNISVSETDGNGNLLNHRILSFDPDGLSSGQYEQVLSNCLEQVFLMAVEARKPVAAEKISKLQRKKFYEKNTKRTRRLSMFACGRIRTLLDSKSVKYKTEITYVDPSYTSKAGLAKYVRRYGLSIHEAASFCIARRGQGYIEKLPKQLFLMLPDGKKLQQRKDQWKASFKLIKSRKTSDFYQYRNPYTFAL